MVATWLLILLALLGLGGTALVVTAIAVAVAKNRPGLAAVLGAVTLLGLLAVAGSFVAYFGVAHRPHFNSEVYVDHVGFPVDEQVAVHWEGNGWDPNPLHHSWFAVGVGGVIKLIIIGAIALFGFAVLRRLTCAKLGSYGLNKAQVMAIVVAVVAMLGIFGLRWQSRVVPPQIAYDNAREAARRVQQRVHESQQRVSQIQAQISHGHAQMSIEALEDKYTAPRIALAPPAPPIAPVEPAIASPSGEAALAAETEPVAIETSEESTSDAPTEDQQDSDGSTSDEHAASSDDAEHDDQVVEQPTDTNESRDETAGDETETATANLNTDENSQSLKAANDPTGSDETTPKEAADAEKQPESQIIESGEMDPSKLEAAHAASEAAKEITAGLASFAKALNRVVDEYTRAASAETPATIVTTAPPSATAASAPVESGKRPPKWVEEGPVKIGDVQRDVIVTDEYATAEECYKARDIYLLLATYDHLARLVGLRNFSDDSRPNLTFHQDDVYADGEPIIIHGHPHDGRLNQLAQMGIGIDYVRTEIGREEYFEKTERSVGPMMKLYTLVEFKDSVDRELRQRWAANQRQERFAVVGLGAVSVLGVLGTVWGLLKVDTATKGYYTKRLFLGVPLGILGVFGLYAFLVEMGFDLPH